jgi:hypothetical protein
MQSQHFFEKNANFVNFCQKIGEKSPKIVTIDAWIDARIVFDYEVSQKVFYWAPVVIATESTFLIMGSNPHSFFYLHLHMFSTLAGLPDFSWCMMPKQDKMYQMSTICTELSQNIPNIHKIFQMAIKYINIFQSEALKFFSQIGIFGLKTNHLATVHIGMITLMKEIEE